MKVRFRLLNKILVVTTFCVLALVSTAPQSWANGKCTTPEVLSIIAQLEALGTSEGDAAAGSLLSCCLSQGTGNELRNCVCGDPGQVSPNDVVCTG